LLLDEETYAARAFLSAPNPTLADDQPAGERKSWRPFGHHRQFWQIAAWALEKWWLHTSNAVPEHFEWPSRNPVLLSALKNSHGT
jgi:hypothetical protein